MKIKRISILCIAAFALSGCGGGREGEAKKMLGKGLKLESKSHRDAATVYMKVVETYPDTSAATSARQRIDALRDANLRASEALNSM